MNTIRIGLIWDMIRHIDKQVKDRELNITYINNLQDGGKLLGQAKEAFIETINELEVLKDDLKLMIQNEDK